MAVACLASSFPEKQNLNRGIVHDLTEAMGHIIGDHNVHLSPFYGVADCVRRVRPDIVILVGSCLPARCDYTSLASAASRAGSVFAYWTVEDPFEWDFNYKFVDLADLVFTNDPWALEFYDRENVYHLPTAASRRRHYRPIADDYGHRALDVFFCGVAFKNRQQLIQDALPVLRRYATLILGESWQQTGPPAENRRISNEALIDYYANSKLVLNIGRNHSLANNLRQLVPTVPGPRTFEAAMAGAAQLYFSESFVIERYFEPQKEIFLFDTVGELEGLLGQLLSNPALACDLAKRAQARCLAEHTYEDRAKAILDIARIPY